MSRKRKNSGKLFTVILLTGLLFAGCKDKTEAISEAGEDTGMEAVEDDYSFAFPISEDDYSLMFISEIEPILLEDGQYDVSEYYSCCRNNNIYFTDYKESGTNQYHNEFGRMSLSEDCVLVRLIVDSENGGWIEQSMEEKPEDYMPEIGDKEKCGMVSILVTEGKVTKILLY